MVKSRFKQLREMLQKMEGRAIQIFTIGNLSIPIYFEKFISWTEFRQGKEYLILSNECEIAPIAILVSDIKDCEINDFVEKEVILNLGYLDVQVCAA